jgi:hypothetical protein
VGIALMLSVALLLTGMTRTRDTSLQSARLAVLDISPTGGGWRQESIAFGGIDDPQMALRSAGEAVFVRPAMADTNNPPAVRQQPFAVDAAGTFAQRVERVWEASGPADPKQRIRAVASFGASGLTLNLEMAWVSRSSRRCWSGAGARWRWRTCRSGIATSAAFRTNALGDFTTSRRGRI